jgi:EAL domain-containing protein (putative c-di-GMP-specific phosphodiesterase class I)
MLPSDHTAFHHALLRDAYALDSLGSGLRKTSFSLYYQPISGADGRIGGVEALLRFRHKETLVTPGDFIPILESDGVFAMMVGAIIDQVVSDAKTIHALAPDMRISVNFSIEQLASFKPATFFRDRLLRVRSSPILFGVEVSEQNEIAVGSPAHAEVLSFSDFGHPILLDDYGIGYSNLSRLADLPTSVIKLDKKFLERLSMTDRRSLTIVRSVVSLAHALECKITCEGIETREQLDVLRGLGCDYFQGFFLARPMPLSALVSLLRSASKRVSALETPHHAIEVA